MSRTPLENGTILRFPDGQEHQVVRLMGAGGSALLYETKILGSELYAAVKELFPARGCVRDNGHIRPQSPLPRRAEALRRRKNALVEQETRLSQKASRKNHQVLFFQPPVWDRADLYLPDGTVLPNVENTYARMDSLAEKGISLAQLIHSTELTLDQVLSVMDTVLDAYAALHEDGFLHGDCQASNLFLLGIHRAGTGFGTACILDFGSARELGPDGLTAPVTDELFSTDGYCAPELMFPRGGALRLSAAADVWSLGFLLLELLTGRTQGVTAGITEFLMLHPEEKTLPAAEADRLGCSPAQHALLNHILNRALCNEPANRCPNAGALREDLRQLARCRALDTSQGLDQWLLWEAAWRYRQSNPSLFQTEHTPRLVKELPVRRLNISARVQERTETAGPLLERLMSEGQNVYLHAAGGAGKSFIAGQLMANYMERCPALCLNLAYITAEALEQSGGDSAQILPALLARQYFGTDTLGGQLDTLLQSHSCLLVLDDLHKLSPALRPTVVRALNALKERYPGIQTLVLGRSDVSKAEESQSPLDFASAELLPLSGTEIAEQVRQLRGEVLDPAERHTLWKQGSALGLPMFLMRYLELLAAYGPEAGFLPDGTMELLHHYFAQREYHANDRNVHNLLNESLPWVAWQFENSELPSHTAGEIGGWLQNRAHWGFSAEELFHLAVDNLAVLEPDGEGSYRFVHDCYQEYFSALFAANCLQQAVSAGDAAPLDPVAGLWKRELTAHCFDLCCLDVRDGRAIWARPEKEVLDALYQLCSSLPRRKQRQLSDFLMNLYAEEWQNSPNSAGRWLRIAAKGNVFWSLFARWGNLDDRTSPRYLKIKSWFNKSGEAEYQLSQLCAKEKKTEKAKRYLQTAVEKGYPPALNDYGEILEKRGLHQKAFVMYQKAVEQSGEWQPLPRAMWHLGQAYLRGQGVEQDLAQAYRWFETGAQHGDVPAQHTLGKLLEEGVGCTRDLRKALFWYEKAAAQGLEMAADAAVRCRAALVKDTEH